MSPSKNMSPSKIYEPCDAVTSVPYWLERNDGSLPETNEESLKILRQGKEVDPREMTIHDTRNNEHNFSLDKNGFQVWYLPELPDYTKDDDEIAAKQYPVLIEKIKEVTGGSHVTIIGHIVRDAFDLATDAEKLNPKAYGKNGPRSPAIRPHADFNLENCPDLLGDGPQLAEFMKAGRRWQIIGAWRPLKTVERNPLAMLDAQTVPSADFIKAPRDYGGRLGAISILKHGNGAEHKWYYLPEQKPDEVWLFKHFDSLKEDGIARQCAHTALELPGTNDLPPRESVEFRAMVFH